MIASLTIVGASGQMGTLFAERCAQAGVAVVAVNRPYADAPLERMGACDAVMLSVPIDAMDHVLDTLAPHISAHQTLFDVCSIKALPMQAMARVHAGPVVGTHPLFGGAIPDGWDPRVAVCAHEGHAEAARAVSELMTRLGFTPFDSTVEAHDRAMAAIQGLNFATSVAYLAAIGRVENIGDYATPSLARRLESARKMICEDDALFATIFETNPHSQELVREFRTFLNIAAGGDVDLLAQLAKQWFPGGECPTTRT